MNIYVETNFALELAFEQEQNESCEQVLNFCEAGQAKLIIPAYSLAEPHEKLSRQAKSRRELQQSLTNELSQLSRTASYNSRINSIQELASLIVQSNQEERRRFVEYRERILNIGEVISLNKNILIEAASCEITYSLTPQDALVYASVLGHLQQDKPRQACFLNRNFKDFDTPDIIEELKRFNCKMIPRFDRGYEFVQAQHDRNLGE
jgi:predicted nucleic acid-binding protein